MPNTWSPNSGNFRVNDLNVRPDDRVYAAQINKSGQIKIGKAQDVNWRMGRLKTQHGDLRLLGVRHGYTEMEKEMHKMFDVFRVRKTCSFVNYRGDTVTRTFKTELFNPSPILMAWIAANMPHPSASEQKAAA